MATIIRIPRKSGARAPQRITGINAASVVANGLVVAFPLTGGFARGVRDVIRGMDLSADAANMADSDWKADHHWQARVPYMPGADERLQNSTDKWDPIVTTATAGPAFSLWFKLDAIANYNTVLSLVGASGLTSIDMTAGGYWNFAMQGSGTTSMDVPVPAYTTGAGAKWHHLYGEFYRNGTYSYWRCWQDGVLSDPGTVVNKVNPLFDWISIGQKANQTLWGHDGYVANCCVWRTFGGEARVRELMDNPWGMYQQGTRTISLPAAAPPAGGIIPRFYHNRFRNRAV